MGIIEPGTNFAITFLQFCASPPFFPPAAPVFPETFHLATLLRVSTYGATWAVPFCRAARQTYEHLTHGTVFSRPALNHPILIKRKK
jgi:hypothetical protein